jgi:hypothetical protein
MERRWIKHVVAGGNRQWLQFCERICLGHPARVRPEERRETRTTGQVGHAGLTSLWEDVILATKIQQREIFATGITGPFLSRAGHHAEIQ